LDITLLSCFGLLPCTSFVALSGFGLNFLFHSGLTKLHHVHQRRNRKEKNETSVLFLFSGFGIALGMIP